MIKKELNPFDIKPKDDVYDIEKEAEEKGEIFLNIKSTPEITKNKEIKQSTVKEIYEYLNSKEIFEVRVKLQDKVVFYELMATMLQAGLPIVESLDIAAEQTNSKPLAKVLKKINTAIETGSSFSDALKEYPKIFSDNEVGVISSGELTGQIDKVFKRLSVEMEKTALIKSKIKSALTYPIVVMIFIVITVYIMLAYVIPQMTQLLISANLKLPLLTQVVINVSDFVVENGFLMLISFAILTAAFMVFKANPAGQFILHRLILRLPISGQFSSFSNQAMFTRNFSSLMAAGVSITEALKICSSAVPNVVYKKQLNDLASDVAQGISIQTALSGNKYFSKFTYNLLSVGEKTAQIDELAGKIAKFYEDKVLDMADNLSKLLQPFIIAIVGGIVGVVALAVMLPLSQLVGNVGSF